MSTTFDNLDYKEDIQQIELAEQVAHFAPEERVQISEEQNARLRRKIHFRVLPLLCIIYMTQALDKSTINIAAIMGWLNDVHAQGQDYALTSTVIWAGIIAAEPFATQLARRFPVVRVLGLSMLVWSALLLGLSFSLSIPPVLVIRFLIGFSESTMGPCVLAITLSWYKIKEQPFTQTVWQSTLGLAGCIISLFGYGFYHLSGKPGGLYPWQWMSIAVSLISFLAATSVLLFLPDDPTKARWATVEEKEMLLERVRENNQGHHETKWKSYQALEAAKDPLTYCLFFMTLFNTLVVGGVNTFSTLLINRAFGFSTLTSLLLSLPLYAIIVLLMWLMAFLVRRTGETCLSMIGYCIVNVAGSIVLITVAPSTKTRGGLMAAFYLMQCFQACNPAVFMMLSRNIAGASKKSVVYAVVYMGWAGGNAIAPQLFQSKWAPRYIPSLYIHLGLYAAFIVVCLTTRFLLAARNRKKIAAQTVVIGEEVKEINEHIHGFEDLTDKENPDFRYSL